LPDKQQPEVAMPKRLQDRESHFRHQMVTVGIDL
jgi:hypothetical protein